MKRPQKPTEIVKPPEPVRLPPKEVTKISSTKFVTVQVIGNFINQDSIAQPNPLVLDGIAAERNVRLIIDATRVTYMDSRSISFLIRLQKKLMESGGKMCVYCGGESSGYIYELLKITNMDRIFMVVDKEEDLKRWCMDSLNLL